MGGNLSLCLSMLSTVKKASEVINLDAVTKNVTLLYVHLQTYLDDHSSVHEI